MDFPEPTTAQPSRTAVLVGYLDYFRSTLLDRIAGLPGDAVRASALPSGWTPLELVVHLTHVERRWLEWGFLGADVGDPWGEERDGRWYVDPQLSTADLTATLRAQGARTAEIAGGHRLAELGRPGERWDGAPPATLERVLLHLVQEYARHVGQLDVVVELAGGPTGE